MKLTFLGTSHGVCSSERHCQSILIETGESRYLIDAGAPVADILTRKNIPFESIKGVFITHMHGDHVGGLYQFLDLCSWYYKEASVDVYFPQTSGTKAFDDMMTAVLDIQYDRERVRLHTMKEGLVFQDDKIRIFANPTAHLKKQNRPSYGYLIEAEGKRIYISGDLQWPDAEDYPVFLNSEKTDALIIECAHFESEILFEKLKDCKAEKIIITHVFPVTKYPQFREVEEKFKISPLYPADNTEYYI